MSMIDTDQVRQALIATTSASGLDETFYDILIPVDDGRDKTPLMIGQLFGVDLIQHPDVPDGQMYIKRKPAANYKPQSMIADLREARNMVVELLENESIEDARKGMEKTIEVLEWNIEQYQKQIQKGPKG